MQCFGSDVFKAVKSVLDGWREEDGETGDRVLKGTDLPAWLDVNDGGERDGFKPLTDGWVSMVVEYSPLSDHVVLHGVEDLSRSKARKYNSVIRLLRADVVLHAWSVPLCGGAFRTAREFLMWYNSPDSRNDAMWDEAAAAVADSEADRHLFLHVSVTLLKRPSFNEAVIEALFNDDSGYGRADVDDVVTKYVGPGYTGEGHMGDHVILRSVVQWSGADDLAKKLVRPVADCFTCIGAVRGDAAPADADFVLPLCASGAADIADIRMYRVEDGCVVDEGYMYRVEDTDDSVYRMVEVSARHIPLGEFIASDDRDALFESEEDEGRQWSKDMTKEEAVREFKDSMRGRCRLDFADITADTEDGSYYDC